MGRLHVIAHNAGSSERTLAGHRQRVIAELKKFAGVFVYLAVFFEAFALYSRLLLHAYNLEYFTYTAPLVSALILGKIILIGEATGLGRTFEEHWPLIVSTLYKAFVFGLLAAAFHVFEEAAKALLYHKPLAQAFEEFRTVPGAYNLAARALVLFCAFIPFFALRELQRVGGLNVYNLFFRSRGRTPQVPHDLGQPA